MWGCGSIPSPRMRASLSSVGRIVIEFPPVPGVKCRVFRSLLGDAIQPSALLAVSGHSCYLPRACTRALPVGALGRRDSVNLAFVEAPSARESPMEFSKRVLIVDDEPNVVGVLLEFFARFQHGHDYDVVPASSAA